MSETVRKQEQGSDPDRSKEAATPGTEQMGDAMRQYGFELSSAWDGLNGPQCFHTEALCLDQAVPRLVGDEALRGGSENEQSRTPRRLSDVSEKSRRIHHKPKSTPRAHLRTCSSTSS